jgi:formamidopyrimidine-DNA glycosylase
VARLAAAGDWPEEELRFVDPRTFGEVVVFDPGRAELEVPELARLGVDPIADGLDRATLRRLVLGRRRQLKALLLDQAVIAGIGNIYADEILHAARLHPERISATLTGQEVTRLHGALHAVLGAAIEAGGSSLRDAQYVDLVSPGGRPCGCAVPALRAGPHRAPGRRRSGHLSVPPVPAMRPGLLPGRRGCVG